MTTGQFPKRRESDAVAKLRAERLKRATEGREAMAQPLPLYMRPRINSSGRLQR